MQVAAQAARSGKDKFAQELRDMVDSLRKDSGRRTDLASIVPVSPPRALATVESQYHSTLDALATVSFVRLKSRCVPCAE